jgi:hypothetical protein
MLLIIHLLILLPLLIITFQDFKQRQISWFLIPLTLGGFVLRAFLYDEAILSSFVLNFSFIALQFVLLTIYFSMKHKRFLNIVDTYMGLGDILFFIATCAVFSPLNFIAFYISSMLLTLIAMLLYNTLSSRKTQSIPLAGAMSVGLILLMIITLLDPAINFYNDSRLLSLLHLQ